MFAYALRAVILIGVLGWYSTGVWKMIDNYFKDRFEKYLREEFIKNPRMKIDLDKYRTKNEKIDGNIQMVANLKENNSNDNTIDHNNGSKSEFLDEVDVLDTMKTISDGKQNEEKERDSINSLIGEDDDMRTPGTREDIKMTTKVINRKSMQSLPLTNNKVIEQPVSASYSAKKNKNQIKTRKFSDEDFNMLKMSTPSDDDFSDLEKKENKKSVKLPGEINIATLPFKPNVDLGHLDTVTEDEYCPFYLDYQEEGCKDTEEWP